MINVFSSSTYVQLCCYELKSARDCLPDDKYVMKMSDTSNRQKYQILECTATDVIAIVAEEASFPLAAFTRLLE
jgi:hypothetical protein